jgi:predicted metal-dependent HD superfamily phosphohydrolase
MIAKHAAFGPGTALMEATKARRLWQDLLHSWGVASSDADRTFAEIVQAYSDPGRFYHTLDHILDVLATVEGLAGYAENVNTVKLAAWLHDVIYDSKASDNEEKSPVWRAAVRGISDPGRPAGCRAHTNNADAPRRGGLGRRGSH